MIPDRRCGIPSESTVVARYSYTDADDCEIFQKVRFEPKGFRYRTWDSAGGHAGARWVWGKPPGADDLIYHLPAVLAAKESRQPIWWLEGEKDADTATAVGLVATTAHQGALRATEAGAEWFRGHKGWVVVVADEDAHYVGLWDAARRVDLLVGVGIRPPRIIVARPRVGKDFTDHMRAGYGWRDLRKQSVRDLRAELAGLPVPTPKEMTAEGYSSDGWTWSPLTSSGADSENTTATTDSGGKLPGQRATRSAGNRPGQRQQHDQQGEHHV